MMNYIQIFPETFFIISLLMLLLLGIVANRRIVNLLVLICTGITLVILIISTLLVYKGMKQGGPTEILLFHSLLKLDTYIRLAQVFVLTSGIAVLLLLNLSKYDYRYEFSILIAFALFGMITLVSANNLISFYLSFELMSISLYVLACFNQNSLYSCEAGVKYFTLGSLSSCIMLYGMSMLYGYTGTTNLSELNLLVQSNHVTTLGLVFICAGLFFKLAIAPFHMWAPDVYQGASTIVTAFFTTTPKIALIAFFTRFILEEVTLEKYFQPMLLCIIILSVLISALGALYQQNLKRLLAYSAIGHIGYILAALSTSSISGVLRAFIYLAIYTTTNIGLFAYLIEMDDDDCTINNLSGIGKTQPVLAFCLSILLFSMLGIPPLAGFFTKFYIYYHLIELGFITLTIVLITASIISCYYYLNIIKTIYFDKTSNDKITKPGKGLSSIIIATSLINILLPLFILI